jgi:hypothetical protein
MPSQSTNVFVSYSHADASLVAPVVKLLRVNKSLVFQDVDDIQPGKRWRSEIAKGITKSHLVVVFWCNHANQSAEVSKEWKAAIEQEKDLLPLLLDATPLPSELGQFQWIDFRGTVGANHGSIVVSQRMALPPAPVRSARRLFLAGLAVAFAIVVVLSLFPPGTPRAPPVQPPVMIWDTPRESLVDKYVYELPGLESPTFGEIAQVGGNPLVPLKPPPLVRIVRFTGIPTAIVRGKSARLSYRLENAERASIDPPVGEIGPTEGDVRVSPEERTIYTLTAFGRDGATQREQVIINVLNVRPRHILLLLGVAFAVTACLAGLFRRYPKRGKPIELAGPHPGEIERCIASELEAEILRRTELRQDGGA